MYDLASRIAAAEKFPSLAFSFKSLDPTILVNYLPAPEREKRAGG